MTERDVVVGWQVEKNCCGCIWEQMGDEFELWGKKFGCPYGGFILGC